MHATQPTINHIRRFDFSSDSNSIKSKVEVYSNIPFERLPSNAGNDISTIGLFAFDIHSESTVTLKNPTILIEELIETESFQTMLASESALAEEWNQPEEDEAWKHL